jgi:hypothetical protein
VDAITGNYDAFLDEGLSPEAAIAETLDRYPEAGVDAIRAILNYRAGHQLQAQLWRFCSMRTCPPSWRDPCLGMTIHTVVSMRWGSIKNGELLAPIEQERFDVFPTGDKNMDRQQRLEGRSFAVLIMSAINWPVVRPHVLRRSAALDDAQRGTARTIDCGIFVARSRRTGE